MVYILNLMENWWVLRCVFFPTFFLNLRRNWWKIDGKRFSPHTLIIWIITRWCRRRNRKACYDAVSALLTNSHYIRSKFDHSPCLFFKFNNNNNKLLILLLYVDDMFVFASHQSEIDNFLIIIFKIIIMMNKIINAYFTILRFYLKR